jgi:hypothetical protein
MAPGLFVEAGVRVVQQRVFHGAQLVVRQEMRLVSRLIEIP